MCDGEEKEEGEGNHGRLSKPGEWQQNLPKYVRMHLRSLYTSQSCSCDNNKNSTIKNDVMRLSPFHSSKYSLYSISV